MGIRKLDDYGAWAAQLFERAARNTSLGNQRVGQRIAALRGRSRPYSRAAIDNWRRGSTEVSLADWLAACTAADLEPVQVLGLTRSPEEARRQAAAAKDPDANRFRAVGGGSGPMEPIAAVGSTPIGHGGGGRRARLYVIPGLLAVALIIWGTVTTGSPYPWVWVQAAIAASQHLVHPQSAQAYQASRPPSSNSPAIPTYPQTSPDLPAPFVGHEPTLDPSSSSRSPARPMDSDVPPGVTVTVQQGRDPSPPPPGIELQEPPDGLLNGSANVAGTGAAGTVGTDGEAVGCLSVLTTTPTGEKVCGSIGPSGVTGPILTVKVPTTT